MVHTTHTYSGHTIPLGVVHDNGDMALLTPRLYSRFPVDLDLITVGTENYVHTSKLVDFCNLAMG